MVSINKIIIAENNQNGSVIFEGINDSQGIDFEDLIINPINTINPAAITLLHTGSFHILITIVMIRF